MTKTKRQVKISNRYKYDVNRVLVCGAQSNIEQILKDIKTLKKKRKIRKFTKC